MTIFEISDLSHALLGSIFKHENKFVVTRSTKAIVGAFEAPAFKLFTPLLRLYMFSIREVVESDHINIAAKNIQEKSERPRAPNPCFVSPLTKRTMDIIMPIIGRRNPVI